MGKARQKKIERQRRHSNMRPTPLAEVKRQLGLDEAATFFGYIIGVESVDEFLAGQEDHSETVANAWTNLLYMAHVFSDFHDATTILDGCDRSGATVALLFDLGDHYRVGWP
jgi:hypothetical protein